MDQKNIEDNDSIVELPQEVNEIDSTQSVPEEIEQIDDFPELETANEPSSVSNFANRGINKLDEKLSNSKNNKNPVNKINNANNKNSNNKMPGLNKNNLKNNLGKNKFGNNKLASALNKRRGLNKIPKLNSNRSQSLDSNSVPGKNNRFKNLFGGRKNKNVNKPSFQKLIIKFIKKNPGLFLSIAIGFFSFLMHFLVILLVVLAVAYAIQAISNVITAIEETGQRIWNAITLNGFETDQGVYLNNIENTMNSYMSNEKYYDKSTVDEDKVRYYTNTAVFYSKVVNPDIVDKKLDDDNATEEDDKKTDDSKDEEVTDETGTFIGSSSELKNKYGAVKGDPKDLIKNMFECGTYSNGVLTSEKSCDNADGDTKKWYFSEEKYKNYLTETYVPNKYINCDNCDYKNLSDERKKALASQMTNEIMSQARSFYSTHNADDKSNYTAYGIQSSGITVKDKEGNIIGKYSLSEYVETIVERDAAKYNDEIKKAYALTVISKLLVNVSNNEIVEDNFDSSIVTDSTKKAVASVIDLKIMKDGKVYYSTFDFEKAQKVNPQEYVAILKALFGDDISIEKSISDGLQLDSTTGFYMRVSSPSPDSNTKSYQDYYGSNNTSLIGECAWYATNRAREITNALGVRTWTTNRNGGTFCEDNGDAIYYERCWPSRGEKCAPKQGAIVSWSHGTYGHVGIIEKVNADNTVLLSHAWIRKGKYGKKYEDMDLQVMEDDIDAGKIDRLDNCIGNGAAGCSVFETISITRLEHIWNGYNIVCYIYLTDPK
jgi:surface antigen